MGFTAVWITPIAKQLPQSTREGTGYHGYWQQDMYVQFRFNQGLQRLNDDRYDVDEHLGTADDVKALSKALHDRGMYFMLDVVANHMVRLLGPT
jgi:alpha-amylase